MSLPPGPVTVRPLRHHRAARERPVAAVRWARAAPWVQSGSIMIDIATFFVAAMFFGVLPSHLGPHAWRILFASGAVPALAPTEDLGR